MSSPALSLNPLVNVSVFVTPQSAVAPTFNVGLIIGSSTVIPSWGTNSRVRTYTGLVGMLTDGFTTSSPEYLAAQLYFGQTPVPAQVQIGRQDSTSIATVIPHAANQGTGYVVGDVVGVTQGGASAGTLRVATVGGSGQVTSVTIITDGTGYSVANALVTTGGTGTGLQVDITTIGETAVTAVTNCRAASSVWWAVMVIGTVAADHALVAAYVQAVQPVGAYFYTTGDSAVLNGIAGNVGAILKAASYTRVFGVYSTTQSGNAPNNAYACAASMGVMMGLNNGLANSNFTMMFKVLTGITAEPLSPSQIGVIAGNNVNVYVGYVNQYVIEQTGTTPLTGTYIDQVLSRDILAAAIQYNIMNLLVAQPSVPQTDPGQAQLIHAVNQACAAAVLRGYLAPGVWKGVIIQAGTAQLSPGDPLPAGFLALSPPYYTQAQADHIARKSMPIYVAVIEAGSVQSVVIGVYIQS